MNTEEIQYWSAFYKHFTVTDPTLFAQHVNAFFQAPLRILDVGCGNGRDSYYLAAQGHKVEGIDASYLPENAARYPICFLEF
jgi:2-polyprenyl-3-methyl-5-hydroxy-6-metoxy-1,4-benzoquinol methylase